MQTMLKASSFLCEHVEIFHCNLLFCLELDEGDGKGQQNIILQKQSEGKM